MERKEENLDEREAYHQHYEEMLIKTLNEIRKHTGSSANREIARNPCQVPG